MLLPLLILVLLGAVVIGGSYLVVVVLSPYDIEPYVPLSTLEQRYLEAIHWGGYKGTRAQFAQDHGDEFTS